MNFRPNWRKALNKGHERTVRARKNVLLSIFYKGIGIAIGFAYFPISLAYLGDAKFGIFLVLASIIDWFSDLDVGVGNGLRNKLGEAVATGDNEKARGYVSTAYFVIGSIFAGVAIIFLSISYFIPWADWLKAEAHLNRDIAILAMMMFGAFGIRFISSMVYQIFYALQKSAMVNFFSTLTKAFFLIIIVALFYTTSESLLLYGAAKTLTFACIPLLVGIYYFRRDLKPYIPSFRRVNKSYLHGLFSLGVQFFMIKIAMIIIHSTNNVLIARYVSLEEVAVYESAYKLLSVFLLLFVILTDQLWAANVEAYAKGEFSWIKKSLNGVLKIWLGTVLLSLLMVLISPYIYRVWLQGTIEIPLSLTIAVAVSITITTWVNLFNLVLNGASKIRLQMYTWLLAGLLNIPLSLFFAVFMGWGTIGIVMGTITCMLPLAIISPLQVQKILSKTDTGIWAK